MANLNTKISSAHESYLLNIDKLYGECVISMWMSIITIKNEKQYWNKLKISTVALLIKGIMRDY